MFHKLSLFVRQRDCDAFISCWLNKKGNAYTFWNGKKVRASQIFSLRKSDTFFIVIACHNWIQKYLVSCAYKTLLLEYPHKKNTITCAWRFAYFKLHDMQYNVFKIASTWSFWPSECVLDYFKYAAGLTGTQCHLQLKTVIWLIDLQRP